MPRIILALLPTILLSQNKTIKNYAEATTRCLKFSEFCRVKARIPKYSEKDKETRACEAHEMMSILLNVKYIPLALIFEKTWTLAAPKLLLNLGFEFSSGDFSSFSIASLA